jgi:2-iminobutanoate/2-iminopropanoate deaminase
MLCAVNPPGATFAGLSQAVVICGGSILVTSGHVPVDESGNIVEGEFETQVSAAFESLARTLKAANVGFESVARLTTYVTDYSPDMLPTFRKVRSRYLSADTPPASVLIAAAALYDPRVRIELEAIAVVPENRNL